MAPILGIWASSRPSAVDTGAMFPLQVITVGPAGASSVEFTNIPGTYTHLQIRALLKDSEAGSGFNNGFIRFNGDTGSNYSAHQLSGNGASVSANGYSSQTSINVSHYVASTGVGANIFSVAIIDVLDYANTNKFKTTRTLTGGDANGSGIVLLTSGNWRNTNAITSITLNPSTGTFSQNSQLALYAVKAAS